MTDMVVMDLACIKVLHVSANIYEQISFPCQVSEYQLDFQEIVVLSLSLGGAKSQGKQY